MVGRLDGEDIGVDPRIICDLSFCGKTSKWEGIFLEDGGGMYSSQLMDSFLDFTLGTVFGVS